MKVRELLNARSRWVQGTDAEKSDGQETYAKDPDATCWCLLGAIERCYPHEEREDIYDRIVAATKESQISSWNDSPLRTFEDVQKLVQELDI